MGPSGGFGASVAAVVARGDHDADADAGDVPDEGGESGETAADDAAGDFGDAGSGRKDGLAFCGGEWDLECGLV